MSKQTAVEWLIEQYVDSAGILNPIDIQNALQMEREQIVEAYINSETEYHSNDDAKAMAKHYYEQNYGKEAGHEEHS